MGLLHASLLNVVPDCRVVAVCEKNRLIHHFAQNILPGVKVVSEIAEFSGLKLDTVCVTTPTSTHYAIIKAILDQKICCNLFVEKPLAGNVEHSARICELVKTTGYPVINTVGYNRRFNVVFRKARELIQSEFNGGIRNFEGYAFSSDFLDAVDDTRRISRGGVLRDLGCHAIDLTAWCLGDLTYQAVNTSQVSAGGAIDAVDFKVQSRNGINGTIKASWCASNYRLPEIGLVVESHQGQRLTANDDKVEFRDNQGNTRTWHKHDLGDNTYYMLGGTDYYREDAEYINAVKTGQPLEPTFATALNVDKIVDVVEKSILKQIDEK